MILIASHGTWLSQQRMLRLNLVCFSSVTLTSSSCVFSELLTTDLRSTPACQHPCSLVLLGAASCVSAPQHPCSPPSVLHSSERLDAKQLSCAPVCLRTFSPPSWTQYQLPSAQNPDKFDSTCAGINCLHIYLCIMIHQVQHFEQ